MALLKTAAVVMLATLMSVFGVHAEGRNWPLANYDELGTNHNPQKAINAQNVGKLAVAWSLEIPRKEGDLGTGVMAPPLVVEGVVYLATNAPSILAVDASSGKILWDYRPALKTTPTALPHTHGINYYDGLILFPSPDCSIRFVNASTGLEHSAITGICENVPGNAGTYSPTGPPPALDTARKVVVWGPSVSGGTAAGRGFVAGYSMNGTMLWRLFLTPPAGGDTLWGFRYVVERRDGFFEGRASGNVEPMAGDWGDLGLHLGRTRAGGGVSFGHISVDSELGVAYLSTANPKPDWNATYRPGPNLYTSSILAVNVTTGDMLWYYQTTPHDYYNLDCTWNTVLAKPSNIVVKGCKNGVVYALNASNGNLLWSFDPPSLKKTIQPSMTKRWHNDPSDNSFLQCPGAFGAIESDIALAYGKVYVAAMNFCTLHVPTPVEEHGSTVRGSVYNVAPTHINTTIYAVDVRDGRVVWSFFVSSAYRGWLTATGGMLIASTISEGMFFLDAETGRLLHRIDLGGELRTGAVVGADGQGRFTILQLVEKEGSRQVLIALRLQNYETARWVFISLVAAVVAAFMILFRLWTRGFVLKRRELQRSRQTAPPRPEE
ncbi:MAG: PQQ-binding-like beta-propeller repeat protein [Candidatus Caldarchaeum sp.]|nr:PQQ-binding-like beta-propeller repeat protein [Candidatus Caldarchaeum sp.]